MQISAADVISGQLTDQGLMVANRTPLRVRLEIEICPRVSSNLDAGVETRAESGGKSSVQADSTVELLRLTLGPRDEGTIPRDRLGVASSWRFPKAIMRQWSHEVAPVYEGGDLTLGMVRAILLAEDGTELGSTQKRGGAGLGALLTATDIRAALG